MTNFLLLVVFLSLGLIAYLILKIQSDRAKFLSRVHLLENSILQLDKEQKVQNNQLQFSDELKQKISHFNATLNKDIYDLNYALFEEIYSKNE